MYVGRHRPVSYSFGKTPCDQTDEFWVGAGKINSARSPSNRVSPSTLSNVGTTLARPQSARGRPQSAGTGRSLSAASRVSQVEAGVLPKTALEQVLVHASHVEQNEAKAIVAIDMLWGNSQYFPAHKEGAKYREYANRFRSALDGKPVIVIEAPIGNLPSPIWDRYSGWERGDGAVYSNASHEKSKPSRVGAFEVHLFQGVWDPEQGCNMPIDTQKGDHHAGPPQDVDGILMCSACASQQRGESRQTRNNFSEKSMKSQHTLLHSKLWSRRWPNVESVVAKIACLSCPSPPSSTCPPDAQIMQEPMPPRLTWADSREKVEAELRKLDCPAQKGWFVNINGGEAILAKCGGGSHSLSVDDVVLLLQGIGCSADSFRTFLGQHKTSWDKRSVNEFIGVYLDEHAPDESFRDAISPWSALSAQDVEYLDAIQGHRSERKALKRGMLKYQKQYEEVCSCYCSYMCELVKTLDGPKRVNESTCTVTEATEAGIAAQQYVVKRAEEWEAWRQALANWSSAKDKEALETRNDIKGGRDRLASAQSLSESLRQKAATYRMKLATFENQRERSLREISEC